MSAPNRPPVSAEIVLHDVPVSGRLPPGLAGTLFRNGPNPVAPDPALHWFFGEGMVHAFRIDTGKVAYRNRWIRTQRWAAASGAPEAGLPEGTANTSLAMHAGALLALEEAHMPVRLDPATLETLGTADFGGTLPAGTFTAHPKRCPRTGSLVFFGYAADGFFGDTIRLGEISADGALLWQARLRTPIAGAMIHDFAVTAHFIAIPLFPLVLDLAAGGFAFKPSLGAYLGVIARAAGPDSLRWHQIEPGFAFHVAQAWDVHDMLRIELMHSAAPPLFPAPEQDVPASTDAFLTRWELAAGAARPRIEAARLSAAPGELPRIDERRSGQGARQVFWTAADGIRARNDATGSEDAFVLAPGDNAAEPVFVPRSAEEGDGWLLTVLYRAATHSSDLAILDAADLAAGPVALAQLPVRVPDGFHGAWLDSAAMR